MTNEEIKELEMYAELEGSEIGDACNLLLSLHGYSDYFSREFLKELENEMLWNLNNFRENCEIVEKEYPVEVRTYKELEWNF